MDYGAVAINGSIVFRSLRISGSGCDDALSSGSSSECEEAHTHAQQEFPVEILPNLYLGNSANSEDCEALARHNIKVITLKCDDALSSVYYVL